MATIYLQLIQNRYMFRSFTVLQCCHQRCVQPVASDVESRRIPLASPVVLIVRMERSTAWRISGTVLKRMPRSGSFILGINWKSQGLKPLCCSILQTGHITLSSTPDQQLENHSTKYHRQQPLYNTLELPMMGIVVPETCWASNKICS